MQSETMYRKENGCANEVIILACATTTPKVMIQNKLLQTITTKIINKKKNRKNDRV